MNSKSDVSLAICSGKSLERIYGSIKFVGQIRTFFLESEFIPMVMKKKQVNVMHIKIHIQQMYLKFKYVSFVPEALDA